MNERSTTSEPAPDVVVIGGGPAGLMAAEVLSAAGLAVTVHDRMASLGRKFLMAGRGGLNLTHSEELSLFRPRYGEAAERLAPMLNAFAPGDLIAWAEGLGQEIFVGSSGRVFPKALKASPLLRAWLARLEAQGVSFRTHSDWRGWTKAGELAFARPEGEERVRPRAVVLALGGGSWAKLGSNGAWADILAERNIAVTPFQPANCGFKAAWSETFKARFAGAPLKAIGLSVAGRSVKGEAIVAGYGLEGGAVYALSATLREAIARDGRAVVEIDLRPDLTLAQIAAKLEKQQRGDSLANRLRKALNLSPVAVNLLRESHGVALPDDARALAALVKAAPVTLTAPQAIDRAISTAGGLAFGAVDEALMLRDLPGVFAAGEMLDWEAPTGGYLLQASFATGWTAAHGVLRWLGGEIALARLSSRP